MRLWIALAILLTAACGRNRHSDAAAQPDAAAPQAAEFQWQIREFRVAATPPGDQNASAAQAEAIRAAAVAALAEAPLVGAVGAPRDPSPATWCGVDVHVAWQAENATGHVVPIGDTKAAALGVQVRVQAEAAGERAGQGEMAMRVATLQLPKPAQADLATWLPPRLGRAVAQSTVDVLAELWARRRPQAELALCLSDGDVWKLSACAREAGERKLAAGRPRLDKLCRDTRKDVAVVACTALGRLGGEQSVPVLAQALEGRHPEVVAAALDALEMLHTPAARQALADCARDHPAEMVRSRAEQLLQGWEPVLQGREPAGRER
ncbi:MAG: HEAT repeat domain-containing protein [Deltaproteobacteria bacterium]|nr:HEAT repeat domain-containing protein [Deltaproteobacteria bacterium]